MAATVVRLPWNGQHWPGRVVDGVPTFGFRSAPPGLATRRQLRARGLCPGGRDWVAQVRWRGGRRWAALYLVDQAVESPGATTAQLISLWKAQRVLRTCTECGLLAPYRLPKFNGRRCWPCRPARRRGGRVMAVPQNVINPRTGVSPAKKVRRAGVPNHHISSGEVPMVSALITPEHFPTPELALRAGVDHDTIRAFAALQAEAAQALFERLHRNAAPDAPEENRFAAVADAYVQALAWRYNLARTGSIVGGTGAVDGTNADRFRTPITDDSPNLDRIGRIGRFRDDSVWNPLTRTYVGGTDTPASRIAAAYGRAAEARFAVECPSGDVLVNTVTLPDGTVVTGNRLIRGTPPGRPVPTSPRGSPPRARRVRHGDRR
ncbi:RRQRL motif-containing zinc-binding protein [Actinokineospora soli]|uniref:RRQRL motif-containing zinc-binding protein n=1 Tax=Actinokineospora soli TaxID=1048753 RepID=A0ABW2TGQ0_9PSEU